MGIHFKPQIRIKIKDDLLEGRLILKALGQSWLSLEFALRKGVQEHHVTKPECKGRRK